MYMYMRQFQSPSRLIVSAILRPPARHLHLFSLQCITVHIHSSGPAITAQPEINHTHLFQTLKRLLTVTKMVFRSLGGILFTKDIFSWVICVDRNSRLTHLLQSRPGDYRFARINGQPDRATTQQKKLEHTIYESAHTISPRVNLGMPQF